MVINDNPFHILIFHAFLFSSLDESIKNTCFHFLMVFVFIIFLDGPLHYTTFNFGFNFSSLYFLVCLHRCIKETSDHLSVHFDLTLFLIMTKYFQIRFALYNLRISTFLMNIVNNLQLFCILIYLKALIRPLHLNPLMFLINFVHKRKKLILTKTFVN